MTADSAAIEEFRRRYRAALPFDHPHRAMPIPAEAWGDTPELQNRLAGLIAAGVKTASCGAIWELEAEGSAPPAPGSLTIVLDGGGSPRCLIETTGVSFARWCDMDAEFAAAEGEGDHTLESWRRGHRAFFTRTLPRIGREFSEEMPLFCERFRVVWGG